MSIDQCSCVIFHISSSVYGLRQSDLFLYIIYNYRTMTKQHLIKSFFGIMWETEEQDDFHFHSTDQLTVEL